MSAVGGRVLTSTPFFIRPGDTMATFGKAAFDTAIYASFRPTYPKELFDLVFKHHERQLGARWDTAVDLGCGTGT